MFRLLRLDKRSDEEILTLLEGNPIGSSVRIVLTNRPSFFRSLKGRSNSVFGVKDGDELVGCASVSIQDRFINGKKAAIGYLSGLRISNAHRGKGILSFAVKELDWSRLGADIFLASIASQSKANMIFSKNKPGYPKFRKVGTAITKLIMTSGLKGYGHIKIARGRDLGLAKKFILETASKKNLFPAEIPKGLSFYLMRDNGRVVGAAGLWDQRSSRQVIIHSYGFPLNLLKHVLGLPSEDKELNFVFLSFLAIEDDDPEKLERLISKVCSDISRKNDFLAVGLDSNDPLVGCLSKFRGFGFKSEIYLVGGKKFSGGFYPEIGLL